MFDLVYIVNDDNLKNPYFLNNDEINIKYLFFKNLLIYILQTKLKYLNIFNSIFFINLFDYIFFLYYIIIFYLLLYFVNHY